ncbi:competence protein ComE [Burkholderia sp. WAC0059]|uniref:ComEA family DNA-binding protein n=1 Tax=Burkholderia sp. WAC0059 TaxID=2066022 RepID=UPI000C7EF151|nr:helix-hairpin-helix domain-containing protein [Burkholderia sp. WAC0059]PLZ01837.1 competence protein ComE [Burkholderia sp. WAC0059]
MFRKLLAAALLLAAFGHAFAALDVNTAGEDALLGIKGIGPARAKAILTEREAHGPFKDAGDFGKRVKGMGGHTVERLQAEGLSFGPGAPAASSGVKAAVAGQAHAPSVTAKK